MTIQTTVNQVRFRTRSDVVSLTLIFRRIRHMWPRQSGPLPGQNVARRLPVCCLFITLPKVNLVCIRARTCLSTIFSLARAVVLRLKVNHPLHMVGIFFGVIHTLSPGLSWVGLRLSYLTSRSPLPPVACMDWVWFGFDCTAVLHAGTCVTMISIFV